MIDNYKNILIIDDNEDDYFIINRCIKKDYKTVYNNGDKNIIDLTKTHNPDCILIDYHLGTKKGIDLLKELKSYNDEKIKDKPVVMLTGETNPQVIIDCMKDGATDYIVKGSYRKEQVIKTVSQAIEKASLKQKIKEQQEEIKRLSRTDELTGTYNRRYFIKKVNDEIARSIRTGIFFSIAMVDLDYFKAINDTYGHQAGDLVLQNLVRIVNENIRTTDYIGRYGGDEFIILLIDNVKRTREDTIKMHNIKYNEIRRIINETLVSYSEDIQIKFSATFGVTLFDDLSLNFNQLLANADKALYKAKENQKNRVAFFFNDKVTLLEK